MQRTKLLSFSAVGLAAALAVTSCSGSGQASDNGKNEVDLHTSTEPGTTEVDHVDWGVVGPEPSSLDPIRVGSDQDFVTMANMCESLFRIDEDFGFGPGLAEDGEWTDEHTYVLQLRDDVTFWNGDEMTSADVVASLERQANPENGSIYLEAFDNVDSFEATGDYEVTVNFSTPDVEFPNAMASTPGIIVQADFIEQAADQLGTPDGGVMCTGPFELDSWNPGTTIEMSANQNYWDEAPLTQELELHYIESESTLSNALIGNELDGSFFVPIASADQLGEADNGQLLLGPSTASMSMGPTSDEGPAADPRFREAISLAIDQNDFVEAVLGGMGEPIKTFTVPFQWEGLNAADTYRDGYDELPSPEQDLDKAKELIDEVDLPDQALNLAVPSGQDTYTRAATVIEATGEELGVDFDIKQLPGAEYAELFYSEEARDAVDFVVTTGYSTTPGVLEYPQQFVSKDGIFNWPGYENEEAESLIFQARETTDEQEAAELFIEAQELFAPDNLQISLAGEYTRTFLSDELSGVTTSSAYFVSPWALRLGGSEN